MINNLEKIKSILQFENEDQFYFLQILKRKKEHPELGSNSYVVKTYFISSLEQLDFFWDEIICLCNFHQARACINLNKRSFEKTAFHTLKKVTDQIMNKDFKSVKKAYNSVCGLNSVETNKKWIVDIDEKDEDAYKIAIRYIQNCRPDSKIPVTIYAILPTKNGWHIISSPFRLDVFKKISSIDVHKDNPSILYIP